MPIRVIEILVAAGTRYRDDPEYLAEAITYLTDWELIVWNDIARSRSSAAWRRALDN